MSMATWIVLQKRHAVNLSKEKEACCEPAEDARSPFIRAPRAQTPSKQQAFWECHAAAQVRCVRQNRNISGLRPAALPVAFVRGCNGKTRVPPNKNNAVAWQTGIPGPCTGPHRERMTLTASSSSSCAPPAWHSSKPRQTLTRKTWSWTKMFGDSR